LGLYSVVGVEMAQAVRRLGASVALVEGIDHLLPREPRPLGEALGEALAADGIELHFGEHASGVRRDGGESVVEFAGGDELRGERLLVATGRRARVAELGLDSVGVEPTRQGVPVDERMRVIDGVWAIGDATGVWPLTYIGKYQGVGGAVMKPSITGAKAEETFVLTESGPEVVAGALAATAA
jgi:pyruvate/2-oxoglutarate dehydrogenase complex dihydrolipoamide dehydrogenase (E3) component